VAEKRRHPGSRGKHWLGKAVVAEGLVSLLLIKSSGEKKEKVMLKVLRRQGKAWFRWHNFVS
jgi:hypothetical protein